MWSSSNANANARGRRPWTCAARSVSVHIPWVLPRDLARELTIAVVLQYNHLSEHWRKTTKHTVKVKAVVEYSYAFRNKVNILDMREAYGYFGLGSRMSYLSDDDDDEHMDLDLEDYYGDYGLPGEPADLDDMFMY